MYMVTGATQASDMQNARDDCISAEYLRSAVNRVHGKNVLFRIRNQVPLTLNASATFLLFRTEISRILTLFIVISGFS